MLQILAKQDGSDLYLHRRPLRQVQRRLAPPHPGALGAGRGGPHRHDIMDGEQQQFEELEMNLAISCPR